MIILLSSIIVLCLLIEIILSFVLYDNWQERKARRRGMASWCRRVGDQSFQYHNGKRVPYYIGTRQAD